MRFSVFRASASLVLGSCAGRDPHGGGAGIRQRVDKLAAVKLSRTITLRDGRGFSTVAEAVAVMAELPEKRQRKFIWQKTCEMLLEAKVSGKQEDMDYATAQLCRALQAEGWMA